MCSLIINADFSCFIDNVLIFSVITAFPVILGVAWATAVGIILLITKKA